MKRVVEVLGPVLKNKGDALMLWAVAQRLGNHAILANSSQFRIEDLPQALSLHRIVLRPSFRDFRAAVVSHSPRSAARILKHAGATFFPRPVRHRLGVVRGAEVDAVLDGSGYAYGDGWPVARVTRRDAHYARLKQQGAALVMLPQAFGPFDQPEMRQAAQGLFRHFDLVFPRDEQSRKHLEALGLDPEKLKVVPDMTHLVAGATPPPDVSWGSKVCIVPNARMLDKTDRQTSQSYIDFLIRCIHRVREAGPEPILLIHERNDRPLAEQLRRASDPSMDILDEDALVSKGILGSCHAVIASRYHAIISALSQGTPTIGTSWSHKYEALFQNYDCSGYLVSPVGDGSGIDERVDSLMAEAETDSLRKRLEACAELQRREVIDMWHNVDALLASKSRRRKN